MTLRGCIASESESAQHPRLTHPIFSWEYQIRVVHLRHRMGPLGRAWPGRREVQDAIQWQLLPLLPLCLHASSKSGPPNERVHAQLQVQLCYEYDSCATIKLSTLLDPPKSPFHLPVFMICCNAHSTASGVNNRFPLPSAAGDEGVSCVCIAVGMPSSWIPCS